MNQDQPAADGPDEHADNDQPRSWKAALPMLIAGGLALAILLWVGISALVNPAEERISDSAKVQRTVNQMYSAMGTLNYERYRDSFCATDIAAPDFPTSVQFADRNRAENDAKGKIVVPSMDVEVTGDRATVTAHWHRENTESDKQKTQLKLVGVDGEWKVCGR
ncbi:hypothetical protein [Gordonia sp. (in: high G+C Gram-positive bacteria)]|uniref:Rv0361 family membrane protein n=1 Tax=Gordonia sp. (in: high G+C Gram-positive bacteria) TaxID=84139 RepID=UPI0016A2AF29|nr:hypothetical protein [Gordonia sp. (in: high G+C Gram-positive bacteria)]NLG47007.1 hypothetical protein [Gordonia sp. (in: high G+C Gram-positive bacteria)]